MTRPRPTLLFVTLPAGALAAALVPLPPDLVELAYARGLYPTFQPFVTGLSSLAPVSLIDLTALLVALAAVALVTGAFRGRDGRPAGGSAPDRRRGAVERLGGALGWTAAGVAMLYLWFALCWGFNYRRLPLEQKLAFDETRLTGEAALALGRVALARVNGLAGSPLATAADDEALARAFGALEHALGSRTRTRLTGAKPSLLGWYFRRAGIDGMTNPFFLEVILNPDLLPFERPFVLAHEWAHLAGYADESEANFVAWLACVRGSPATQYSGWLAAYEHALAELPAGERRALRAQLAPRPAADLRASRDRVGSSSPAVSQVARAAYDTYLKANRVEAGVASYGAVVRLMLGTAFDEGWTPRLRR